MAIGFDIENLKGLYSPNTADDSLKKERARASWDKAVLNAAILSIVGVVTIVVSYFIGSVFTTGVNGLAFLVTAPILIAIIPIATFILLFIEGFLLNAIARFLGGKGTALEVIYLMSLISIAFLPLTFIVGLLSGIPLISCVGSIASLVISIYALFLQYKMLMLVHSLPSDKAIISLVLFFVIILAVTFAIGALIVLFGMGAILGTGSLMKGGL